MPLFLFVSLSTNLSICVTDLYKKALNETRGDPLVMLVTAAHSNTGHICVVVSEEQLGVLICLGVPVLGSSFFVARDKPPL